MFNPSGIASSRVTVFVVAGIISCFAERILITLSSAPAAPSKWPVIDFVPLIATCESLKTALIPLSSLKSPRPVEVACALI
ncbi:hypothetical protein D3C86_2021380 [compost metagenome]